MATMGAAPIPPNQVPRFAFKKAHLRTAVAAGIGAASVGAGLEIRSLIRDESMVHKCNVVLAGTFARTIAQVSLTQ